MLSISNQSDAVMRAARANGTLAKSLEKLSSGSRINRASDDAGGLAISESLRTQVRGLAQAASNIQDAINIVKIGEDGVNSAIEVLQRLRELVVQAANGTNSDTSLAALQTDLDTTKKLILDAFEVAQTFRMAIDGAPADRRLDFQVGANEGQTITVDYNSLRTTMVDFVIQAYGYDEMFADPQASGFAKARFGDPLPPPNTPVPPLPGFPAFPPGTTFSQAFPKKLMVNPNDTGTISESFTLLDTSMGKIIREEAYLGATHNRLEYSLNNVMTGGENLSGAESRIRDADMASETTSLTRSQILAQSATSMIAQSTTKQVALITLLKGVTDG